MASNGGVAGMSSVDGVEEPDPIETDGLKEKFGRALADLREPTPFWRALVVALTGGGGIVKTVAEGEGSASAGLAGNENSGFGNLSLLDTRLTPREWL